MAGPFAIVPVQLTDAMLVSSTIAEPDTARGEAAWAAGGNYTVGQDVVRPTTHKVYRNVLAGVNATPPEDSLTLVPTRWVEQGTSNKWAGFDGSVSTQSVRLVSLSYVLTPGPFNSISFYGLVGAALDVSIKTQPGGAVFFAQNTPLIEPVSNYYDYYFSPIKPRSKVFLRGIALQANPEITITVSTSAGQLAKLGMASIGVLKSFVTVENSGGTKYGAKVKPTTFSYVKVDDLGNAKIVKRGSATNINIDAFLAQVDADAAVLLAQELLDVPAAYIGSDLPNYAGLNAFGLGSFEVSYDTVGGANLSVSVQGTN